MVLQESIIQHDQGGKYDRDIGRYKAFINQCLDGISVKASQLVLGSNGDTRTLQSFSIDTIPGLSDDFKAELVPNGSDGDYHLDLIVYTSTKYQDEFDPIAGGQGLVKVNFGYLELACVRQALLTEYPDMIDVTTKPLVKGEGIVASDAKRDTKGALRVMHETHLYLYYDPNFNKGPAFVIHIPKDPYDSLLTLNRLFQALANQEWRFTYKNWAEHIDYILYDLNPELLIISFSLVIIKPSTLSIFSIRVRPFSFPITKIEVANASASIDLSAMIVTEIRSVAE